jgi:hypothetical protein
MELNEQWRKRSQWLFQRCVNETDMAQAQLVWNAACNSEKTRLEWQSLCLGHFEQEGIYKAFAVRTRLP